MNKITLIDRNTNEYFKPDTFNRKTRKFGLTINEMRKRIFDQVTGDKMHRCVYKFTYNFDYGFSLNKISYKVRSLGDIDYTLRTRKIIKPKILDMPFEQMILSKSRIITETLECREQLGRTL